MAVNVRPPETTSGTADDAELPLPSCHHAPLPQQYEMPPVVTAHVCIVPVEMALYALLPDTDSGTALDAIRPLPNWPSAFLPQQNAAPVPVSAQVCWLSEPALKLAMPVRPLTRAGASPRSSGRPSPPKGLLPRQHTAPPLVRPQVWPEPVATVPR